MNTLSVRTAPSRNRVRSAARIAAFAMILPVTACLRGVSDPGTATSYGAITITGFPNVTNARATSRAIFFPAYSVAIPNSRVTTNSCQFAVVDTTNAATLGITKAGASLGLVAGAGTKTTSLSMPYDPNYAAYFGERAFDYAPGDSVTVTMPGDAAGYPPSSIKLRLAEPVLAPDVTIPVAGSPMQLRWNTGDSTSAIIVSLKYASPSTVKYANEQVICTLVDDGAEDLSANALVNFNNSPPEYRSLRILRWRTLLAQPTVTSVLHIVSTVDTLVKLK